MLISPTSESGGKTNIVSTIYESLSSLFYPTVSGIEQLFNRVLPVEVFGINT